MVFGSVKRDEMVFGSATRVKPFKTKQSPLLQEEKAEIALKYLAFTFQ